MKEPPLNKRLATNGCVGLRFVNLSCVSRSEDEDGELERTVFSVRDLTDDTVTLRAERPALLISSTSWTGGQHTC